MATAVLFGLFHDFQLWRFESEINKADFGDADNSVQAAHPPPNMLELVSVMQTPPNPSNQPTTHRHTLHTHTYTRRQAINIALVIPGAL